MLLPQRGFSLVELLVALSILSIISFIAIPSFNHLKQSYKANTTISQLANTLRIAKLTAINQGHNTIICPKPQEIKCSTDWSSDLVVFTDLNQNRQLDQNESSKTFTAINDISEKILFNGHQGMVRFSSSGFPQGTFGTFTYCPSPLKPEFIRSLIINMQGQIKNHNLNDHQKKKLVLKCNKANN